MSRLRVILGLSGASGAALGLSAARQLKAAGVAVDLVVSPAAERTLSEECGDAARAELLNYADEVHEAANIGARIASGSAPVAGMLVAPCSMRTLAAVAHGLDDNLLTRAASVQLKERRKLVLLARETPLTLAHLRNMTAVTEMGAVVMPPAPAFYLHPQSVQEIVDQTAARAIDQLRITEPMAARWPGSAL